MPLRYSDITPRHVYLNRRKFMSASVASMAALALPSFGAPAPLASAQSGPLHNLLTLAVGLLVLIAFVVAVRQALDVPTGRAVLVCLLAMVAQMALLFVLVALVVGTAGVAPPVGPPERVG